MTTTTRRLAAASLLALLAGCSSSGDAGAPAGSAAEGRPAAPGKVAAAGCPAPAPCPPGSGPAGPVAGTVVLHDRAGLVGGERGKREEDALARLRAPSEPPSTEQYAPLEENPFLRVARNPLSTFSIDVDTASYAQVRRFLNEGRLPPAGAVRLEELINYFPYAYAPPTGSEPFAVHLEAAACPWKPEHRLVRIGIKGRTFDDGRRPASNLVFLVDVSGSMNQPDKLPLLRSSLRMLAEQVGVEDRVAIVVYAGSSGLALPSTTGDRRQEILDALDRLEAGGSTNGAAGIRLAYQVAEEHFIRGGTNRVVLATDGDFNVGTTSNDELVALIREKAKSGVFLSVLGFGTGNVKDDRMEALADRGNGNYAYIDSLAEGRKVLVEQAGGTLHAIAKDVKIQVEFNPARVAGYRLLGYEDRLLRDQDFADDTKDAGEIGAGHTVTALYEVVPVGVPVPAPEEPALKYQENREAPAAGGPEMLTVSLRWKEPEGSTSRLAQFPLADAAAEFAASSADFRFASAVACFGMALRGSDRAAGASFDTALELAAGALGDDPGGWRHEFLGLAGKARSLQAQPKTETAGGL